MSAIAETINYILTRDGQPSPPQLENDWSEPWLVHVRPCPGNMRTFDEHGKPLTVQKQNCIFNGELSTGDSYDNNYWEQNKVEDARISLREALFAVKVQDWNNVLRIFAHWCAQPDNWHGLQPQIFVDGLLPHANEAALHELVSRF